MELAQKFSFLPSYEILTAPLFCENFQTMFLVFPQPNTPKNHVSAIKYKSKSKARLQPGSSLPTKSINSVWRNCRNAIAQTAQQVETRSFVIYLKPLLPLSNRIWILWLQNVHLLPATDHFRVVCRSALIAKTNGTRLHDLFQIIQRLIAITKFQFCFWNYSLNFFSSNLYKPVKSEIVQTSYL